jgi:protein translocase SecG subunit
MKLLPFFQILVSLLLLFSILIQANGTSVGRAFGGSTGYHTKRGAEKALFIGTIVLSVIFISLSLLNLAVNR